MHFVYILLSEKTGKYYVGQTSNLEARLARHNAGRVPATKATRPWTLAHIEEYASRLLALSRERELKSWHSHERINRLIQQARTG
jgi:putative endonuclease